MLTDGCFPRRCGASTSREKLPACAPPITYGERLEVMTCVKNSHHELRLDSHALGLCDAQAALECLLGEKAELLARTAHLENRLHEVEATAAKAAAEASALSEEGRTHVTWPAGGVHADAGGRTHRCRSAEVAATQAAGGEAGQQQHPHALLLRTAGIAAKQSGDETDRLRHELKTARAEHAQVVASAAEERARSARKMSTLEDAVEETKLEFQSHKDMAEARLEILRVAFDQEERENNAQVRTSRSGHLRGLAGLGSFRLRFAMYYW